MTDPHAPAASTLVARDPGSNTLIARLVAAWGDGSPVPLTDLLPPDARPSVVADVACQELELRVRAGEPGRAAEYLERYSQLAGEFELYLIEAEILCRKKHGPPPTMSDFAAFPHHREAIEKLLSVVPRQELLESPEGYEILEEIGRGGMGVVYAARDVELKREVAVKVLQSRFAVTSDVAKRFVEEAQITGQLQHPGIPAVHQVGKLSDGRPFLAMKRIKGRTLDELIKEKAPLDVLAVFEAICQAVGYAHERGVIHRDLKPQNVMVGAFGEVQVMDWGLAKFLGRTDPPSAPSGTHVEVTTSIEDPRTPDRHDSTGAAGTPWYMPPEQAAGEQDRIDRRADVFAMGGVLCAMLTGKPPIEGETLKAVVANAIRGDTAAALARLGACAAAAELIALCKRCLAFQPCDRPTDAGELAREAARLRTEAAERARRAEVERGKTEVRVAEEKKRRRVRRVLYAVLATLAVAAAGFAWERQTARIKQTDRARQEISDRRDKARLHVAQLQFTEAASELGSARRRADADLPDMVPELDRLLAAVDFSRRLDDIRYQRWVIDRTNPGGGIDFKNAARGYRAEFERQGFDFVGGDPSDLTTRVNASLNRTEILAALEDWSCWETDTTNRVRVLAALRAIDPDPAWRDEFRTDDIRMSDSQLARLGTDARNHDLPTPVVVALADVLGRQRGHNSLAEDCLLRALSAQPKNFGILFELAALNEGKDVPKAAGYYRAARVLRPDNRAVLSNLAGASLQLRDAKTALECSNEIIRIEPNDRNGHLYRGDALYLLARPAEAEQAYRTAIALGNQLAETASTNTVWRGAFEKLIVVEAHWGIAKALGSQTKPQAAIEAIREAVEAIRQAVEMNPANAEIFAVYGWLLHKQGEDGLAREQLERASRLPNNRKPAWELLAHLNLKSGRFAEAARCCEHLLKLDPENSHNHYLHGDSLRNLKRLDEAADAYRAAIKTNPTFTPPHFALGRLLLIEQRKPSESVPHLLAATAAANPSREAYHYLGIAYKELNLWKAAETAYRAAIELNNRDAHSHRDLGEVYTRMNDLDTALKYYRKAAEIEPRNVDFKLKLIAAVAAFELKKARQSEFVPLPRAKE